VPLVATDGVIVGEWYWKAPVVKEFVGLLPEQWTRDTMANIHSSTKSITAALVGIAQDRGLLKLADYAHHYIASWAPPSPKATITIADLLSMDSGLHWSETEDYIEGVGLAHDKTAFAEGLSLDKSPGTWWVYNNMGVQVLQAVLRNATGEDPVAFAQRNLFGPIGLGYPSTEVSWLRDGAGNPTMYDGVQLGCRGLARMAYLWMNNGSWAGKQVVSAEFVRSSVSNSTPLNDAYGYLWWLGKRGHYVLPSSSSWPWGRREGEGTAIPGVDADAAMMLGANGQFAIAQPSRRLVITRMGEGTGDPSGKLQAQNVSRWVRDAFLDLV
jgi:CubicO group peptidase (beta-lactamase class C family)